MIKVDRCSDSLAPQPKRCRARGGGWPSPARVFALVAIAAVVLAHVAVAQAHGLRPGVRSAAPTSPRAVGGARAVDRALPVAGDDQGHLLGGAARLREVRRPGAGAAIEPCARCGPTFRRRATLGRVRPALFAPGFVAPASAPAAAPPTPTRRPICSRPTTWRTCPRRGAAATRSRSSTPTTIRPPNPTSPSTAPSTACRRARARTVASPRSTSPATPHRCRRRTRHGSRRCRSTSTRYRRCAPTATSCSSRRPRPAPPTWRPRWRRRQPRAPTRSRPAGRSTSNGILSGAYVFPNVSTVAATGDTGYLGTTLRQLPGGVQQA